MSSITEDLPEDIDKSIISVVPLQPYQPTNSKGTVFYSDYNPNEVLDEFTQVFKQLNIEPKLAEGKWKMTFETVQELSQEEVEAEITPKSALIKVDFRQTNVKDTIALDFTKVKGDSWVFLEKF